MSFLMIIFFVILIIVIYYWQKVIHEKRIHEKVRAIGGNVITIERRSFRTGPFILAGEWNSVYRIEYEVQGQIKEGWVKFGGLFGPDWRL